MIVVEPSSKSSTLRATHLIIGLVLFGCNSPGSKSGKDVPTGKEATSEAIQLPKAALGSNNLEWSRADWLSVVEGFLAQPETMPRLDNAGSRPQFEKLITTKAWLDLDWRIFEGDPSEAISFFPTTKRLTVALGALGAIDETVALGLFSLDVYRAFLDAGTAFISRLPAQDTSKSARLAGMDQMRLGAALGAAAVLYLVLDASEETRNAAFDRLAQPSAYSFHSREGLQLLIATLEQRLIQSGPPDLRPHYERIRAVIAAEHAKRSATPSPSQVTYEGLGPPGLDLSKLQTVVSTTGKFSVKLGPGGLAKRVDVTKPDGSKSSQHWIELQYGGNRSAEGPWLDSTCRVIVRGHGQAKRARVLAGCC